MSRYIQFVTPENIEVSYELAGIGSRMLAAAIDHALQLIILVAVALILSLAGMSTALILHGAITFWLEALLLIGAFLVIFGYFILFELMWAGQTPGKRLLKLRVVRDGGWPIDPYASIVRNLVRIADFMPPIYNIGLISVFLSGEYKRLGDYAAGTVVIKERADELSLYEHRPLTPQASFFLQYVNNVDALSVDEYRAIRRFTSRRHELEIPIQAHIAMRLALPIIPSLGLTDLQINVQWHYADLLEAIEKRYVEENRLLDID